MSQSQILLYSTPEATLSKMETVQHAPMEQKVVGSILELTTRHGVDLRERKAP